MSALPEEMVRVAMERCRHFRAMAEHDECAVGVRYADVVVKRPAGEKGMSSIPCFVKYNELGATCDRCSFLSREEAEARVREWESNFERAMRARAAIVAAIRNGAASAGEIPCPICGAALRYSMARSNGHVHARCATPKCVGFME